MTKREKIDQARAGRGRPPTGHEPAIVRDAKSKAALISAGGRRLNTTLEPTAARDLQTLVAHLRAKSEKEALAYALRYAVAALTKGDQS